MAVFRGGDGPREVHSRGPTMQICYHLTVKGVTPVKSGTREEITVLFGDSLTK
jgi:hypothetical protein